VPMTPLPRTSTRMLFSDEARGAMAPLVARCNAFCKRRATGRAIASA
jgi:hypothetical protein